jgi:hypothetical protein
VIAPANDRRQERAAQRTVAIRDEVLPQYSFGKGDACIAPLRDSIGLE